MKSFRDPSTNILKALGYCDVNAPGDIVRDEPEDFGLEPGKWKMVDDTWQPFDDHNAIIQAQIDQLQRESMLNRGSREMEIYLIEKEAREYSEIYGLSVELILSGNTYYPKLKALDAEITVLYGELK